MKTTDIFSGLKKCIIMRKQTSLIGKVFNKIYIEISNICNLQCSFCPVVERDQFAIDKHKLKGWLEQVKPYAERVCFHVMGEPLNHPNFCEFVEIAYALNVDLEITSNGTKLNSEIQDALLRENVKQVNFSLQSFIDNFPNANPVSYFEKILAFAGHAHELRPDLYINYRLWNLQDEKLEGKNYFFLRALENKYKVSINPNVDVGFKKSKRIFGRHYLHFDSRFEWPNIKNPIRSSTGTCYGTRNHLAILAEGHVVPCCLDKEANLVLGDISKQSFTEILQSPRLHRMREGFEKGELVEDLCQRCSFIDRFSVSNRT